MLGMVNRSLAVTFALLTAPGLATAQGMMMEGMVMPALVGAQAEGGYFHQVSQPEVIATPVAQGGYPGPTAAGPQGGYAGVGPAPQPDPFAGVSADKFKCCEGENAGQPCKVDRYLQKPTHLSKEQMECVVCLKEPYTVLEPVKEQVEAIVFRCFKTQDTFEYSGCEDGTCFHKKGQKELKRMRPCTIKVDLNYEKKVVKYRDVWYHVYCE